MKKTLSLALALVLMLGLTACGDSAADNTIVPTPTVDTGEVVLTPENVYDYVTFDIDLENVQRWQRDVAVKAGQTAPSLSEEERSGFAQCTIVLEMFAKKPVSFDSVRIQYELVPDRSEYAIEGPYFTPLKVDGSAEERFFYQCNVGGADPVFTVKVLSVEGKVLTK